MLFTSELVEATEERLLWVGVGVIDVLVSFIGASALVFLSLSLIYRMSKLPLQITEAPFILSGSTMPSNMGNCTIFS